MQLLETQMEDLIASFPDDFLNESGLKLIAHRHKIGNYIFDLLFEDRYDGKLIVVKGDGSLYFSSSPFVAPFALSFQ